MSAIRRSPDFDVIIAGAGGGGAASALALAQGHELRILVVERHAGPGNLNRGESLLPPVTALLRRWGALDRCLAAGARHVSQMQFFHHRDGLVLDVPLSLPDVRDPYLVLPHPAIERVFVEAAEPDQVAVVVGGAGHRGRHLRQAGQGVLPGRAEPHGVRRIEE